MANKLNILFVLGTRPEAIKLAPIVLEMQKHSDLYNPIICNTEQQKELSNQTLRFFNLSADYSLNSMIPNQSLEEIQSRILERLTKIFNKISIDATIVQGDTMSVLCGALVSFYNKIPVFHIEAGLRSYNMNEPFPEEAIRQMTSRICSLHFAPTIKAVDSLKKENIDEKAICLSGNTVIDALFCLPQNVLAKAKETLTSSYNIELNDKIILATFHRRENHGIRLNSILSAVKNLSFLHKDHTFVIPVHPNPNVRKSVINTLGNISNIRLMPPLDYPLMVILMKTAKLIMTDSGGIQEEAPSFRVPILVLRNETERKEGIECGIAKLVGTNEETIINEASKILINTFSESRLPYMTNPYGDGSASIKILSRINTFFK